MCKREENMRKIQWVITIVISYAMSVVAMAVYSTFDVKTIQGTAILSHNSMELTVDDFLIAAVVTAFILGCFWIANDEDPIIKAVQKETQDKTHP